MLLRCDLALALAIKKPNSSREMVTWNKFDISQAHTELPIAAEAHIAFPLLLPSPFPPLLPPD